MRKFTSHKKETMQFSYPSDAVRFLSDAVRFSVGWSTHADLGVAKNSVRVSVNLKLLLNRKELESVLYEKVAPRRYLSTGV